MNPIIALLMGRRIVKRVRCADCQDTGVKIVVWKTAMYPDFKRVPCDCPAGKKRAEGR